MNTTNLQIIASSFGWLVSQLTKMHDWHEKQEAPLVCNLLFTSCSKPQPNLARGIVLFFIYRDTTALTARRSASHAFTPPMGWHHQTGWAPFSHLSILPIGSACLQATGLWGLSPWAIPYSHMGHTLGLCLTYSSTEHSSFDKHAKIFGRNFASLSSSPLSHDDCSQRWNLKINSWCEWCIERGRKETYMHVQRTFECISYDLQAYISIVVCWAYNCSPKLFVSTPICIHILFQA